MELEQEFALLAALHESEEAVELAREQLLLSQRLPPAPDARVLKLKLLQIQHKIARLQREGKEEIPAALWDAEAQLLHELGYNTGHFATRSLLLKADDKKQELFSQLLAGVPLFPGTNNQAANLQQVGQCNNGHDLLHFDTPTANFTCDLCNVRCAQAVPMYGCRECDFDVCASCFAGNALQRNAHRPKMDFSSILLDVLTNVSRDRDTVFQRLTEHALGICFSLTACGLFHPSLASADEFPLAQACAQVFTPSTLKGRLNLRALCEAMTSHAALIALSRFAEDECILRLILCDLQSGKTSEDVDGGLPSNAHAFGSDSAFLPHLTTSQLQRLGAMEQSIASEDWFAQALLSRVLPNADEAEAETFYYTATLEQKSRLIAKIKQVSDSLRKPHAGLDYLLLHHLVKLDRERRQPLLPSSLSLQQHHEQNQAPLLWGDTSSGSSSVLRLFKGSGGAGKDEETSGHSNQQTNLPLLLEYLKCMHRPNIMPPNPQQQRAALDVSSRDPLCTLLHAYFPMPSASEDRELISREMFDLFAWKDATEATFLPLLNSAFVHSIHERATGKAPTAVEEGPSISFCDFNPRTFPVTGNSAVELTCDFANLQPGGVVQCKVFEVDAARVLRKTLGPVRADINLDGLMPHREFDVQLGGGGGARHLQRERIRVLDDPAAIGCFVVEIVGSGIATRAVIQRGAIRCIETREAFGHVFYPFELDPNARMLPGGAELWVENKIYKAEEDGRIIVPYSPPSQDDAAAGRPTQCTAVLTCGARSHSFSFTRLPLHYELRATLFVDRESLVRGIAAAAGGGGNRTTAQLVVDSCLLFICGEPAPLSLLKDAKVALTCTDDAGISTQQLFPLSLDGANAIAKEFKIIPNLRRVHAKLWGKLDKASGGSGVQVDCQSELSIEVNQNEDRMAVFMRPRSPTEYELVVLGRTGEAVEDFALTINFAHESSTANIPWLCNTDANGVVDLGDLSQVQTVHVSYTTASSEPERKASFSVPKDTVVRHAHSTRVVASENDLVQFIFPLPNARSELTGREFALVDLQTRNHLFASYLSLSPDGTHVYVSNLKPGDYAFHYFSPREKIEVSIAVSASMALLSREDVLRLPLKGKSRVFAAKPKHHAVTIASLERQQHGNCIAVKVQGGSTKKRRVHAVFRSFSQRDTSPLLLRSQCEGEQSSNALPQWFHTDAALYVSMRKLDEEMVYCMDRLKRAKQTGNLLPLPTLLMNAVDLGKTETDIVQAKEGGAMPKARSGYGAAPMRREMLEPLCMSGMGGGMKLKKMSRRRNEARLVSQSTFVPSMNLDPSLDFLPTPSTCILNLVPDAQTGLVSIPLPTVWGATTWVEIIAVDGEDAAKQTLFLGTSAQAQYKDLRHRLQPGVELEDHIVENQSAQRVNAGQVFEIGDASTAKLAVLDTLTSHFAFCKSALQADGNAAEELEQFSVFFCEWNALSLAAKQQAYASLACHELNFMLKRHDLEFFNQVIRVQLEDKPEHCLLERFLLEDVDGLARDYANRLDLVSQLETAERAMLAVALGETHAEFSSAILAKLKDEFQALRGEQVEASRKRLFQVAIQVDNGASMDGAAAAPPPPPPAPALRQPEAYAAAPPMGAMPMMMATAARVNFLGASLADEQEESMVFDTPMAAEEEEHDSDSGGESEVASRVRQSQALAEQAKYKEVGPAHRWTEAQYALKSMRLHCSSMNAGFWHDWAQHALTAPSKPFLSPDLCLAPGTSLSEALLQLGAIDAPSTVPEHAFTDRTLTPSVDCICFHQQIHKLLDNSSDGEQAQQQQSGEILLGQRLLDYEDFIRDVGAAHGGSGGAAAREPAEVIQRRVYISRTVITNISSEACHVKLLDQIPEYSMALNGAASQTVSLHLGPFSTVQHLSPRFYFPHAVPQGARWFPAHVSHGGALLAFASPARTLEVRECASKVDEASWTHVSSPQATIDQVVSFLERNAEQRFDLRDICWRFHKSKSDWERVVQCLDARGIYSPLVHAFALAHGDAARTSMALHTRFASQVGPRFDSKYVRVVSAAANNNAAAEVFPLVNARAHALVSETRSSANAGVNLAHQELITLLCYHASPASDAMRVRLAIQFVAERKYDLAKRLMQACASEYKTVQAEYMRAYLSFYTDSASSFASSAATQQTLEMAERYAQTHPNAQWRERFESVAAACRRSLRYASAAGGGEDVGILPPAKAAANLAFEIEFAEDEDTLRISTTQVPPGAEFQINVYKTNVEYLFSAKPFSMTATNTAAASDDNSQTEQFILPNFSIRVCAPATEADLNQVLNVKLPPQAIANENVLIQVTHGTVQRTCTKFTCAMRVSFMEQRGVLRCVEKKTLLPLGAAYCKVYSRALDGRIRFHKDGYTDVCGEMDYCALNTGSLANLLDFAVLVTHPQFGSLVQRVAKPVTF